MAQLGCSEDKGNGLVQALFGQLQVLSALLGDLLSQSKVKLLSLQSHQPFVSNGL